MVLLAGLLNHQESRGMGTEGGKKNPQREVQDVLESTVFTVQMGLK